jgi:hypothetical protein
MGDPVVVIVDFGTAHIGGRRHRRTSRATGNDLGFKMINGDPASPLSPAVRSLTASVGAIPGIGALGRERLPADLADMLRLVRLLSFPDPFLLGRRATGIAAIFTEIADGVILLSTFKAHVFADGVPRLVLIAGFQEFLILKFIICF